MGVYELRYEGLILQIMGLRGKSPTDPSFFSLAGDFAPLQRSWPRLWAPETGTSP